MEEGHQNLEAVMTTLLPLVSYASGSSCAKATEILVNVLREALDGQEASSKRAAELKVMDPKDLLHLLTPKNGKASVLLVC